jgi:hypothetical protein
MFQKINITSKHQDLLYTLRKSLNLLETRANNRNIN